MSKQFWNIQSLDFSKEKCLQITAYFIQKCIICILKPNILENL